jgi:alkylation response protein AidB-like acyl-CoA dehydrogenase
MPSLSSFWAVENPFMPFSTRTGLDYERAVLAAGPLGIMQACLDVVIPYVHERKQLRIAPAASSRVVSPRSQAWATA